MNGRGATAALQRAAEISRELLAVADCGDVLLTQRLDAERRELLQSARRSQPSWSDRDRGLLQEIIQLNDQAIGFLEHRRRCKGRDLDMLIVGKRAVRAYSANGRFR
jgi:hypothetical protein